MAVSDDSKNAVVAAALAAAGDGADGAPNRRRLQCPSLFLYLLVILLGILVIYSIYPLMTPKHESD